MFMFGKKSVVYSMIAFLVWPLFLGFLWFFPLGDSVTAQSQRDLLRQSYDRVFDYDYALDKEARDMFGWWIQISSWWAWNYDSVVVRAGRLLIRVAVLLAVPMFMYLWIKLALAVGNESKMREVYKQAGYVAVGILLALMSVMIVYFIIAFFRSNQSFISW